MFADRIDEIRADYDIMKNTILSFVRSRDVMMIMYMISPDLKRSFEFKKNDAP